MSTAFEGARKSIHDRPPFLTIILYVITKYTAKFFFFLYFRAYVKNVKALPKKGRVIIAPIHRSNLDAPLVGGLCRRKVHYIAKGSLFEKKFAAWALPGMGAIPLDRTSTADKRVLDASMNSLLNEQALVVFPEGERKAGPEVFPVLDGASWLAARAQTPILPVGIGGSQRAMPKGKIFPTPRRIVVLYGDLVPPPELGPGKKRVARSELREYSETLRDILQDLFDEAQIQAGSPNESN
jgi:1-acyl-sn-glycerol-3-phosphate acyltransferase